MPLSTLMMSPQPWSQFKQKRLSSEDAGWIYAPARDQRQTSSTICNFSHSISQTQRWAPVPTRPNPNTAVSLHLFVWALRLWLHITANLQFTSTQICQRRTRWSAWDPSMRSQQTTSYRPFSLSPSLKNKSSEDSGSGRALMAPLGQTSVRHKSVQQQTLVQIAKQ